MPTTHTVNVGMSLNRLRRAIFVCFIAIGVGLIGQILVWSLVTFTELRWAEPDVADNTPLIVQQDIITTDEEEDEVLDPAQAIRNAVSTESAEKQAASQVPEPQDEALQRNLGQHDATLGLLARCAKGFGTAGIIALLPLVMLSTLLGVANGVTGCDRIVSVFNLSLLLALLVLPLGDVLSLPWSEGALTTYGLMTTKVEAYQTGPATALGPFIFYSRFLILPMACLLGSVLLYLRFTACVEQAIVAGDEMHVASDIEAEASNVKVVNRGSRAARAMDSLSSKTKKPTPAPVPAMKKETIPRATQVSSGDLPKRII